MPGRIVWRFFALVVSMLENLTLKRTLSAPESNTCLMRFRLAQLRPLAKQESSVLL